MIETTDKEKETKMKYRIWNTDTDRPYDERVFATAYEAEYAMIREFPTAKFDGVEVPLGIVEQRKCKTGRCAARTTTTFNPSGVCDRHPKGGRR